MLSVGPFVDAPAAAGPADTAALRNPKDVIANGMCSANILLSLLIKMNRAVKFLLPVILAVAFLTGCKTPPPINWDSRVGHYTYAQAVTELGPPARQARLSDGKAVYKWFVQPLVAPHFNSGMSYYGSTGFGAGPTIGASIKNEMLQLTFDTNGTLIAWSMTN